MFSNPDLDLPSPHYSSNFSSLSSQSPPPTSTSLVLARHLAKLECHRNPNLNFKTEYKKLHQNLLCQSDPQVYSASKTDENNDQISVFLDLKNDKETAHEPENDKNNEGKGSVPEKKETTQLIPIEIPKSPQQSLASEKNELSESNHVKLVREAEPQKQVSAEEYKELLRNSKKISIGKTSAKKSILKNFGEEPKNDLTEKKEEGKKSIKKVQINEEVFDKALQAYEFQINSSKKKENEEKMEIIEDEPIPLRKTPSKKKTADKMEIFHVPEKNEEPIIENLPVKEPISEPISKILDEPERKGEEPKVEEAKPQSANKSPKRSRKSEKNEEKLTETPHSEKQMEISSQKEDEKEEKKTKLMDSAKRSRGRKKSSAKPPKNETKEKPKKMSKSAPQKESARKSRKSKDKEEEPKEEEEKKVRMNTRSRKIKAVPTPMTIMTRSKKSLA